MKKFVNASNIVEAGILEPYINSGESWDPTPSRKWSLVLVTNAVIDGFPYRIEKEYETKEECEEILLKMNLICL